MHLRLGLFGVGILSALVLAAPACSSSDNTVAQPATMDASTPPPDGGTQTTPDAGGDKPVLGEAITAEKGKWTWVPFADSSCANGTPTGIGVNIGTSKRLLIYMEGGGACWDALTCYSFNTAANLDGWDETAFKARSGQTKGSELDRDTAANPFKDDSFVYIPYCTGDVHAGDKEQMYSGADRSTKHFGRRNMDAFLKRIVPTFKDAERVVLSGSSAGGFGAAINYWRVKKIFGSTRVDLLDDSGPPFPPDKIKSFATWEHVVDLPGAVPPDCSECATDVSKVLPYYLKTYPDARFALLSSDQDKIIKMFFQITDPAVFPAALEELNTTTFDPSKNGRVFELSGDSHTMLGDLTTKSGTAVLVDFLTTMESDKEWTSVKPAQK